MQTNVVQSFVRNIDEIGKPILKLSGSTIQFLTAPDETRQTLCVMKATLPPGNSVPLHSHEDVECFYLLSGQKEVLIETQGELLWKLCNPGDYIFIPGGAKHALRNKGIEPATSLCITTAKLGRFFEEIGIKLSAHQKDAAPTAETVHHLMQTAQRYGYWLATPEENAAVGISLF
jgi:quercetin dioxygenase-like cupin family protein